MTPEMSNHDTRLTKPQKSPQFVTLFCQIIVFQSQSEVTAICQIMTAEWQVVTQICQILSGMCKSSDRIILTGCASL